MKQQPNCKNANYMSPTESYYQECQRIRNEHQYQRQQREQMRCLENSRLTGANSEVYVEDVELMDHLRSLMGKKPVPRPDLKAGQDSNCKKPASTRTGTKREDRDFGDLSLKEQEKLQREALIKLTEKRKSQEFTGEVYVEDVELMDHLRSLMGKHPVETSNLTTKVIEKSI